MLVTKKGPGNTLNEKQSSRENVKKSTKTTNRKTDEKVIYII